MFSLFSMFSMFYSKSHFSLAGPGNHVSGLSGSVHRPGVAKKHLLISSFLDNPRNAEHPPALVCPGKLHEPT